MKNGQRRIDTTAARMRWLATWLAASLAALALGACSPPSDEVRIRSAISDMQAAMEAGKPGDFMQHVAGDFTGDGGAVDKQSLHNLLRAQALGNARIGVTVVSMDIELLGDRATARVDVTLTGGYGRWMPERGSIQQIESGWRREDGHWLCYNAQWKQVL